MEGLSPGCPRWRGSLALAALDRLGRLRGLPLRLHLRSCSRCRLELAQLGSVAAELSLADPSRLGVLELLPPDGVAGSGSSLTPRSARGRGRRLAGAALGVGVAAVVLGLAAHAAISPSPSPLQLRGSPGVQASAVLTKEPSGTAIALQVSGQPRGQVYLVSVRSRNGAWWVAGSYKAEPGTLTVHLSCGVSPAQVDRIWVENSTGKVVLQARA
ncbi:MAG TPA: hypothetical protein VI138_04430 [Candidatus Dormibacteraeota bacterium]